MLKIVITEIWQYKPKFYKYVFHGHIAIYDWNRDSRIEIYVQIMWLCIDFNKHFIKMISKLSLYLSNKNRTDCQTVRFLARGIKEDKSIRNQAQVSLYLFCICKIIVSNIIIILYTVLYYCYNNEVSAACW